jgi:hypothetical protein
VEVDVHHRADEYETATTTTTTTTKSSYICDLLYPDQHSIVNSFVLAPMMYHVPLVTL